MNVGTRKPIIKGDPFRRDYGALSEEQKAQMENCKCHYEAVWTHLEELEAIFGRSRDLSVAKTELQTSCMWAIRAVTKGQNQE